MRRCYSYLFGTQESVEISDQIPSEGPGWGVPGGGFIGEWRGVWGGFGAPLPRGLGSGLKVRVI